MAEKFTATMGVEAGIAELNNRFECFTGGGEPYPTYPCMFWADFATGLLKQRNMSNDGWVTLYSLATGALALLESVYPVGTIYENGTVDTNPAELFGFGTWEPFGQGRVTVGVDPAQAEFNTLGKTGGEKTHTLTLAEIPSHQHGFKHTPSQYTETGSNELSGGGRNGETVQKYTDYQGSGQAHNNLQPYITVYRWIRVA